MRNIIILFILSVIIVPTVAGQQKTTSDISLNTPLDSACYSIGINWGADMSEQLKSFPGGEVNLRVLVDGLVHVLLGDVETLLINPEFAQVYVQSYLMDIFNKEAEIAKNDEIRFLAENKTKEGVITTESGLQYKVLKQGEGDKPTLRDNVTFHYTGTFLDGTVFDSSEVRGEPMTLGVTQVISGWTELLTLMPLGSRFMAWIPSELAYGSQGYQAIKPNSTLIFEIELLGIEVIESE